MTRLSLQIPEELHADLQQIANDKRVELSTVVVDALEGFAAETLNKPTSRIVVSHANGQRMFTYNDWAPERIHERQQKQDAAISAGASMKITGRVPQG